MEGGPTFETSEEVAERLLQKEGFFNLFTNLFTSVTTDIEQRMIISALKNDDPEKEEDIDESISLSFEEVISRLTNVLQRETSLKNERSKINDDVTFFLLSKIFSPDSPEENPL